MKRKKHGMSAIKRFLRCIDLPEYAVGKDECIEIWGGNTLWVDGGKGIHTYEKDVVRIRMKTYLLAVYGTDFDLLDFGKQGLQLIGRFERIEWEVMD